MIKFIEDHPEMAENYANNSAQGRKHLRSLWEALSEQLNCLGLPVKTSSGWRKVWVDNKYRAKKKLSFNKLALRKTGGGPPEQIPLTVGEEKIAELTKLETTVSGNEETLCFGAPQSKEVDEIFVNMPSTSNNLQHLIFEENCVEQEVHDKSRKRKTASPASSSKRTRTDDAYNLFQKQSQNEKNFQDSLITVLKERNIVLKEQNILLKEQNVNKKKFNEQILEILSKFNK